jgi:ABC-type lipoprotein export system ATPase subunit
MSAKKPIITMTDVSKEYPSFPQPVRVLRDITFQVNGGECVAIAGPSGSGKSTLLNLMGTLDTASSGRILFKDREIAGLSPRNLAQLRNREIGFVFQLHHLLPQCTVIENVLVPTLVGAVAHVGGWTVGSRLRDAYEHAVKLLGRVGLGERLHHRPGQLSGGERQRVAVVRALINRPSLLLADEPTGSLNQEGAERLADLILELNHETGMAVVLVTHSLPIAERFGRILELQGGRLVPKE